jgi:hypothetical protein
MTRLTALPKKYPDVFYRRRKFYLLITPLSLTREHNL